MFSLIFFTKENRNKIYVKSNVTLDCSDILGNGCFNAEINMNEVCFIKKTLIKFELIGKMHTIMKRKITLKMLY